MNLTRPLVVFDIEATGLELATDRIVTLYALKLMPDGSTQELDVKCNPGFQMSDEVIEVHGITNEMVKDWPPFSQVAQQVHDFISGCDMCGFNARRFDCPMLYEELLRCGITWQTEGMAIIDPGNVFQVKEPRSLEAAVRFYCKRSHEGAHDAKADVLATRDVLFAQLNRYDDLIDMDVPALGEFSRTMRDGTKAVDWCGTIMENKDGVPVYGTKRNRGVPVTHDRGYGAWIMRSSFPSQTRTVLRRLLDLDDEPEPAFES